MGLHKKDIQEINGKKYWLGIIRSPNLSKETLKVQRGVLEKIENLIIYIVQPILNEKKIKQKPGEMILVNRWYTKKGIKRKVKHPICSLLRDEVIWKNYKLYQ